MFKYLTNFDSPTQLEVLISLYNDIRDIIKDDGIPYVVYLAYVKQFPQFEKEITKQYSHDKSQGFPSEEDVMNDMELDQEDLIEQAILEVQMMYEDPPEFRDYLQYLKELADTLSSPGGSLVYAIEERFKYLDKYYANLDLGLKVPQKEW